MRCARFLLMIALLVSALPARAQDTPPGVIPMPKQDAQAKKHVRYNGAPKPKTKAADTTKKTERAAKTTNAKVTAAKKSEPKQAKPAEAKAVAPKPAAKSAAAIALPRPAPQRPNAASAPAAAVAPAGDALSGMTASERLKIQAALLWSGDYTGSTGGEDAMLAAIKSYQKRYKAKVTGALTPPERAALVAAAKVHEEEFGWTVVVDPATGIRLGLPSKLVPQARDAVHGTRWSSAHGEVQVETFRYKDPALTLAALFEREKKEPATRQVEQSALHDDDFYISGMQGLKMFSVRAKMRDGEIRGITLLYDQMMEGIVAPVTAAMAASFSPFPERSAPFAALAKSVEYGNGLVVSGQGHIVTDLALTHDCQVIVASGLGDADRIAADNEHGLALLRIYGPRKGAPLMLAGDAPKPGDVTLVGIPDPKEQDGSRRLTEVRARLADGSAIELRHPVPMAGFSGAAALDAQGHVLGMMEMGHAVLASVEASAPPVRLISADTIRSFLLAQRVETPTTPGADAKAAVVRIICVRK